MAHISNKGMFRMSSFVVWQSTTRGSTSKVQNFPGGGVGARSSAVRRAISARTLPSVCTSAKKITASDAASSADFYATQANGLLVAADYSTIISNTDVYILAAAQATAESGTSSDNAVLATVTSSAYGYFTETQQHLQDTTTALANAILLYNQAVINRDAIAALSAEATAAADQADALL